jgi:hypothetical protein
MNDQAEKLATLNKLVSFQNEQAYSGRVEILEEQIERLAEIVNNMRRTLVQLQMDFSRDHNRLLDSNTD